MRFLFLIHGDTEAEAALSADARRAIVGEYIAYSGMLRERGAYVHGEALAGPREPRSSGQGTSRS